MHENPWPIDPAYVYWALLCLGLFLVREAWAGLLTPKRKDTFSHFVWWAFDRRIERIALSTFIASLYAHFVWYVSVWPVLLTGAWCTWIVIQAFRSSGMAQQYSLKKGARKVLGTIGEIITAIFIAGLPQIIGLILDIGANTPASQLHIPAEWATIWYLVVRFANNAWKNRSAGVFRKKKK